MVGLVGKYIGSGHIGQISHRTFSHTTSAKTSAKTSARKLRISSTLYHLLSAFELSHGGSDVSPPPGHLVKMTFIIILIMISYNNDAYSGVTPPRQQFSLSSKGPINYHIFQSGFSIVETRKKVRLKSPTNC